MAHDDGTTMDQEKASSLFWQQFGRWQMAAPQVSSDLLPNSLLLSLPFPHHEPNKVLGLFGSSEAEVCFEGEFGVGFGLHVTDGLDKDSLDNGHQLIHR